MGGARACCGVEPPRHFHSGGLGVKLPGGYFQLNDRSKDIIISGGENI